MYQYIYDLYLNNPKFSRTLAAIESRLTDLGMTGRIDRLTFFKNVREIVSEGIKNGIKTLVVVGNDATLNRVINAVSDFNITLGFIPVGPKNKIAKILGIPEGPAAVDVLSFRRIENLDLGEINNWFFLSEAEVLSARVTLKCDKNFDIFPEKDSHIAIYNLPANSNLNKQSISPQDGVLEVFIEPKNVNLLKKFSIKEKNNSEVSVFFFKNLLIGGNTQTVILMDGTKTVNTPAEVKIHCHKLKMIIGKKRLF